MINNKGKSAGGLARAAKLTPDERKAIARKGVEARAKHKLLPKVRYDGTLHIGDGDIPCAVLSNERRVLSETGITNAILGDRSGAAKRLKSTGAPMPLFLAPLRLKPFIDKVFPSGAPEAIEYTLKGRINRGYDASILPKICEIWLLARDAGVLQEQQLPKAAKADLLMRALANVGIIALIDEATGYQNERAKDALAEILEKFVAKELQPYVKTFPAEFYSNLFKLWGLPYPPSGKETARPAFFGKITNDIIYQRLAPGILPELKKMAKKGRGKLHQGLTQDHGHPKLREHLASIITLQKLAKDKYELMDLINKIHPKYGDYPLLASLDPDAA